MGFFISVEKTVECVVVALFFATALTLASHKILGALQACGYRNGKFLGWVNGKDNMLSERLALLALACALSSAVLSLCFYFAGQFAAIISLAAFLVFFVLYAYADSRVALRCPAVRTPRFMRLLTAVWLVLAIVSYLVVTLLNFAAQVWDNALFTAMKYVLLAVMPLLLVWLICLSNLIMKIYETPHANKFIKKAKAKLAASDVTVVGITGSYGKTTAKNILAAFLAKKYRVLATPRSFNTPSGFALTVNNNRLEDYDVLVCEMGARRKGDIAELCAMCPPDYSLITGICPQHLATFASLENIVAAKGEIIGATEKNCVVAGDCFDLFQDFGGGKIVKCDCVSDVVADCTGTAFALTLNGKIYRVKTRLLGEHAAYNIGLCAQLACLMGVSEDDVAATVGELDFVEHRLQLIESNGVNILDDGYNSNVVGAEAAIKVLKSFGGKKIAVTPGLIELGVLEEQENHALGAKLVGLDCVILVGETLVGAVRDGYLDAGGDAEKLFVVPSLTAAQDKLKDFLSKGDTVLFLNDLPDVY